MAGGQQRYRTSLWSIYFWTRIQQDSLQFTALRRNCAMERATMTCCITVCCEQQWFRFLALKFPYGTAVVTDMPPVGMPRTSGKFVRPDKIITSLWVSSQQFLQFKHGQREIQKRISTLWGETLKFEDLVDKVLICLHPIQTSFPPVCQQRTCFPLEIRMIWFIKISLPGICVWPHTRACRADLFVRINGPVVGTLCFF